MPLEWNFADVWETVAETVPDAIAQVHGDRRCDWRTFDRRADGVAARLLAAGLARHDKVALYLYNTPEYLETAFGVMKAALVPVNTNYRYQHDELHYLWDNADAAAVVFDGEFTDAANALRARCPQGEAVAARRDATVSHARRGRRATRRRPPRPPQAAPFRRGAARGDDPIFIYTGGTTGRPKGVMWRQHDLYMASNVDQRPACRRTRRSCASACGRSAIRR